MTRVYLVRHGVHDLVGKVLAGRMDDVPLNEAGRQQASALAAFFADRHIGRLASSPMLRCQQTGAPIATTIGRSIETIEALNEIDCGDWTGQTFTDLDKDPRWHDWNAERSRAGMPNGETMLAVQTRVMTLIDTLAMDDSAPMVLVSHSDVVKAIVMALLRAPLDHHDRLTIDPASVTTLDLWPGGGKIVRLNEAVPQGVAA
ncbi:histidine phosphatase family protein [Lichenihabitans psoromatis]|uniref:histidine phosphatase family protein n=1 Tax=Lichenihabitans psoromatis TaxID=2528642 RepID=UPI001035E7F2|nr:histidine phosphatase family protein [Lichenihabitans psoromatis]